MRFKLPPWGDVLTRYAEPHVMRTRATGTPFRVRTHDNELIVTTAGGSDRPIPNREFVAAWSFIDGDAPKSAWKHVSANSSYLEAIYDDLREHSRDAPQPAADDLEAGLMRQRIRDLEEKIAFLRDGRASGDSFGAELARERETNAALERRIAELVERQPSASVKELGAARHLAKDLRRQLEESRAQVGQLQDVDSRHRRRVGELEDKVAKLEKAPAQPATLQVDGAPVTMTVRFDLGAKSFGSTHRLERPTAELLDRAAAQFDKDPNYTITVCRQVLEGSARRIWEGAHKLASDDDLLALGTFAEMYVRRFLRQEPPNVVLAGALEGVLTAAFERAKDERRSSLGNLIRELSKRVAPHAHEAPMPSVVVTYEELLKTFVGRSENVEILNSALNSAKKWGRDGRHYLGAVRDALAAVVIVADRYAAQDFSKDGLVGAFADAGQRLVPDEFETTQLNPKTVAAHTVRNHQGHSVTLGPHIRFGDGKRMYLGLDEARRVIYVGWVGDHLPVAKYRDRAR